MNKFFKYMICCLLPLTAVSCLQEEIDVVRNESIVLTFDSGAMTKAADTDAEAFVAHVDVMIFASDESRVHHERVNNDGAQTFALQAERSGFTANTGYYVYLVANSSLDASVYAGLANINALRSLVQSDSGVMFTGLAGSPQHFLMDAVAYTADAEPATPGTVVLNDGVASNSTKLKAVFRRAAAKVFITIKEGTDVVFADAENSATAAYFMRNCPYQTTVIDGYNINSDLETLDQMPQNANFVWGADQVTVAAYGYEHEWANQSAQDKATTMVVNVPLTYNGIFYANNWYKIPVSESSSLERNHYYSVTVTVNAPGAENKENPQTVDNVAYEVLPWEDVTISVGDSSNNPQYLQLNTNHVDMYNVNSDNSTLKFASSSAISSITLVEAYYMNYLDEKINLSSKNPEVYAQIKATAEAGVLNGGITINSPFIGKTEEEKQQEILALEIPTFSMTEPTEPAGKPAPVENPGDTQPADPNSDAVLDEIAEEYSSEGWWDSVEVSWTRDSEGNVTFTDNSMWSNASQQAQEEYNRRVQAYNNYPSLKAEYDAYLAELAAWEAANSGYVTEKAAYDTAYAAYQEELRLYNEAVAAINNSSGDSHSNAIRYLKFTVTNATGQTAQFTVQQYPTIYITNEKGNYSYRSDFGGTTYEGVGSENRSGANWNNGGWTYGAVASGDYFFGSKVATGSEGNYSIQYVYWQGGNRRTSNINGLDNPRMYHVHVTATSANYIVSVPRLDSNGYTESSAENTKLVSPSFMIASQLGATMTPNGGIDQAKSHCEQYVEVTDGKVYDDWRLPTAAEIDIIIQHQDVSDAMAVVLTGNAYYCAYNTDANGNVIYTKDTGKTGGQRAVRCIRDAY